VAGNATLIDLRYTYSFTPDGGATRVESILLRRFTDSDGTIADYAYDQMSRLVRETRQTATGRAAGTRAWTYDANGNRATQTLGDVRQVVTRYTYNDGDELRQATTVGPGGLGPAGLDPAGLPAVQVYLYDDNGNLSERSDGLKFEYDAGNLTTTITPPASGGGLAARRTMTYADVDQTQRVVVQEGTGSTSFFAYDRTGFGPSSVRTEAGESRFTRTPGGGLISLSRGGETFYYLTDGLGSVVALVGRQAASAGGGEPTIVNRYQYDPWGNIVAEAEEDRARQPLRFAGAEFDLGLGLYKMGARYYDPGAGRFTQVDALGVAAYARNNPLRYIDTLLSKFRPA
jgi:RHS repeat-associated protein